MRRLAVTNRHKARRAGERGVALIMAMILLLLLTGLGITMYVAVNSDMMINGYYRNFRGSFYGADSGLTIIRQDLANRLIASIPLSFDAATQPIPPGTDTKVRDDLNTLYGGTSFTPITTGKPGSWPAKFQAKLTDAPGFAKDGLQLISCTPTPQAAGSTCAAPINTVKNPIDQYTYIYNYHITAYGRATGTTQKTMLEESGTLTIVAKLTPSADTPMPFSGWGMFIDKSTVCDGSTLVPGTLSGPVFTNGGWNFGTSGSYIFTDSVGQSGAKAGFQFSNGCDQLAAQSASKKSGNNTVTIAPTFASPMKLGQAAVPLPTNDFNQQRAVLDGQGSGVQPSKAEMNATLRNVGQGKYPTSGSGAGVWLPYDVDAKTGEARFTGGGIYVEGDAQVQLSTNKVTISGKEWPQQIYSITQGTGGNAKTTTITVTFDPTNPLLGTTTVTSGGTTQIINNVPVQRDPNDHTLIQGDATMLYVNGNITGLSGPGQGQPAVQDGAAVTITASQNIAITGDILYKTPPVTKVQDELPGKPADTLIPGNDKGQSLGIFTASGNIQLKNSQNNGNLEIDASLAAISQGGSGGLVNVGNSINKLTIMGGRIQNTIQNIGATTRNVFFDRRYSNNNFAPPWFPSTTITHTGMDSAKSKTASFQRLQWLSQTSY